MVFILIATVHISVHPNESVCNCLCCDDDLLVGYQAEFRDSRTPLEPVKAGNVDQAEIRPSQVELNAGVLPQPAAATYTPRLWYP
jgi:hypothetical protein